MFTIRITAFYCYIKILRYFLLLLAVAFSSSMELPYALTTR
jgi:hypothetical protein